MVELKYKLGNALEPEETGLKYIIHVCNDIGAYGSGFVAAIANKWPIAKLAYLQWYKAKISFALGQVQFVQVESDIVIVNMIAQHLIGYDEDGGPCIRYQALEECLNKVANKISETGGCVICPYKMGSERSGGRWEEVEKLLTKCLVDKNINVTAYELKL